jgi:uncharacterized protein with gpF-like domain
LKTVAKIAQGPFDARRLALAKVKRDAPELVMRAEILRAMKLSDAQKQQREALQKQQQTQTSPTLSRGR